jgi:tRNA(Arg) A34 adenosine deaminase TadA
MMRKNLWKTTGTFLFVLLLALTLQTGLCWAESTAADTTITAENPYMTEAIREALDGISQGHGGPFGCVIVKDGEIIGAGHNMVLENKDSTAHGEITAIRNAEDALDSYDLSGCELYTTGEPCPMCLYAILWANISKVYYGCTIEDNADIGFRDEAFDKLSGGRESLSDFLVCIDRDACLKLFKVYSDMEHQTY